MPSRRRLAAVHSAFVEQHARELIRTTVETPGSTVHLLATADVSDEVAQLYRLHRWVYDAVIADDSSSILRGRKPVVAGRLGRRDVIVKRLHHGGLLAPLLGDRFLTRRRFSAHAANAAFLRVHGIATPAVVFAGWRRSGGFVRGEIGLERLDGVDADRYFFSGSPAAADEVSRAIGALVRRMHDAGFVHGDLNLMNVLVRGPASLSILDLDKGTIFSHVGGRARRANLERLYRSIRKQGHAQRELAEKIITGVEEGYVGPTAEV